MKKGYIVGAACLWSLCAWSQTDVRWEITGHKADSEGKPSYVQRFVIKGDIGRLSRLCFNMFDKRMRPLNPADTVGTLVPGYYYIGSPRFATAADSLVIDIETKGVCPQYSFGADGLHGVDKHGKPFEVSFSRGSATRDARQWSMPGADRMPYGPTIYERNEELLASTPLSPFDMAPSLKKVTRKDGICRKPDNYSQSIQSGFDNPEYYKLEINADGVRSTAASPEAAKMARRTYERLVKANPKGLPCAIIEDWPDYHYRGMMIDVARNFQPMSQMKKFVDAMADLRLNRLQFHFADDEAWRLEIPALPELTSYGARRGYTTDEKDFPAQIYAGTGDPSSASNHGFYTRKEFIDFLRYCYDRGITLIPEIETPGHARVAVKAMDARWRNTGDDSLRMREDGDTSRYKSAQDYHDCVLNPALPGPYKFMDMVSDEIKSMYEEAGVPLTTLHIGGDEVPHGAWSGSPSAQRFMKEKGINDEKGLHAYWVAAMAEMMVRKGLKIAGWQEIGVGHDKAYSDKVAPNTAFINLWVASAGKDGVKPGTKARESGFPVLACSVTNYYLDLAHSYHPDERGLNWGGVTDEFKTLHGYPEQMAPASENSKSEIIGVQGQMWAETMRSPQWMERYLFPRILALAERAWNSDTTYNDAQFNRLLGEREIPALAAKGIQFHLRQPGAVLKDGKVVMNSPYADAEIRYTLDGTDPTSESTLYTAPFYAGNAKQIRARLFYKGMHSVSTILNPTEK